MSVSKTRQKLVDVARLLFAKNGLESTTMNDIAQASGKGRRTLYTYFKSKEEIYYAVIESELERLSDKLDEVAARKIRPQEKIMSAMVTCVQSSSVTSGWWKRCASTSTMPRWNSFVRCLRRERKMGSSISRTWNWWPISPTTVSRDWRSPTSMDVSHMV